MSVVCVYCQEDIDETIHARWDYEAADGETFEENCPKCGKPLSIRASVEFDYAVKVSPRMRAEREKYERRMKGDWS